MYGVNVSCSDPGTLSVVFVAFAHGEVQHSFTTVEWPFGFLTYTSVTMKLYFKINVQC